MYTLNCRGRLLVVEKPLVMGILNITPDSFYEGSRFTQIDNILRHADKMLNDGADILDVGGQSTRPGSKPVSLDEEIKRVIPAIETINKRFPSVFISVDTYYAKIAVEAVNAGASIINDISAGVFDEDLIPAVAKLNVPYVLMHIKGTPQNMQQDPVYENVVREVLDFFIAGIAFLKESGIKDIIVDPGIGFGKTITHNFELLKNLEVFRILDHLIMIGISRKSTISKTLGVSAQEALNGTTVLNTVGLLNGASIIRVHDVKEAVEAVKLIEAVKKIKSVPDR